ncbi:unnamed protein product [Brachionus calyciflorus]|uniref:MAGE domain-containing protein n=1 Tax=Brachionus calyciflorus TaxID=104777 RepID=A0A814PAE5_9BILA|nr:unnamed protein product [Brachionus calyciflorus]
MSRMSQSQYHHDDDRDDGMIEKRAQECVEYVLFCCLAEKKSIVRKADLNKNVIKDQSRSFKAILKLLKKYLDEVFGLELIDLDSEKNERFGIRSKFEFDSELDKLTQNEAKKGLSQFSRDSSNFESDQQFHDQLKHSMLMISLSLIFMNGNEIDAQLFWDSLKRLDINRDEKRHKYLGDIFKYFTVDLVKEGYLEYEQIVGIDPPTFKFKWGYRAKLEITKKSILNFVCEMYGGVENCKPEEWVAQYADAMKVDEFNKEINEDEIPMNPVLSQMNRTVNSSQGPKTSQRRSNNELMETDLYDSQSQGSQRPRSSQRLRH